MEEVKEKKELKIDFKNIIKVVGLLYVVLIVVGILTYILPAGAYPTETLANGKVQIIPGSTIEFFENGSPSRIPWWRWLTVPIESLFLNSAKMKMYEIFALLLILGGCFKVLEECGSLQSLIKLLIVKFKSKRFVAVWLICLLFCLLASFFGIQDELLILFPIILSFCEAMNWSKTTACALILIASSTGFTCAILNPYTVGICSDLAGSSVLDGAWYRAIMLVTLYVFTALFLVRLAKKDEKEHAIENASAQNSFDYSMTKIEKRDAYLVSALFIFVLIVVVVFSAVPVLQDLGLGLIIMGIAFVIGTIGIGGFLMKDAKKWLKAFFKGVKAVAPSLFIIATAYSIMYLAERAQILHTIFYYIETTLNSMSPYLGVIVLLFMVLIIEFFIPSATAKASLIIPLLTLGGLPFSTNIIILCYLLGDGYANVIFPTCGTLMIGLGLADVSLIEWYKKTILFQLFLLCTSIIYLLIAVKIGL